MTENDALPMLLTVTDAFNRGDVEALAADTTEDVELFAALGGAVEGGSFHGRAGIEAYFQITAETWSEFRIVAEDFSDLGDRVLVAGRIRGASGPASSSSKAPRPRKATPSLA